MINEEWVDENHIRVTLDGGRKSYLFESDGWTITNVEVEEDTKDDVDNSP